MSWHPTLVVIMVSLSLPAGLEGATAPSGKGLSDLLKGALPKDTPPYRRVEVLAPWADVTLARGVRARTVVVRQSRWESKGQTQRATFLPPADKGKLSEAELRKQFNRIANHIQVWVVSLAEHPTAGDALKKALPPNEQAHEHHREMALLGRGHGHAWYMHAPVYAWVHARERLKLSGGDDPLEAAVRGMSVEDKGSCTRNSCAGILGAAGAKAIPYVEKAIAAKSPYAKRMVWAFYNAKERAVTAWLIRQCDSHNPELAATARHTLVSSPRKQAAELYRQWLAEAAGKADALRVLRACREVGLLEVEPLLKKILEAPASVWEYRKAFEWSRELSGKKIALAIPAAEKTIREHGYGRARPEAQAKIDAAVKTVLASGDPQAAAMIGLSLAVATGKGGFRRANEAGIRILRELPDDVGKGLVRRALDSCKLGYQKRRLRDVAGALGLR